MKHFRLSVDGKPYEIEILSDPRADEVLLKVDGQEITVTAENLDAQAVEIVDAPVAAPAAALVVRAPAAAPKPAAAPAAEAGSNTVKAPLPGVINAIKVREGQTVKVNDPLVVIEAMKAMNVIRAQRPGTISRIHVNTGDHIAYGAPLLDIE